MTPSGIEPATIGLVAQCLNQLRHRASSTVIAQILTVMPNTCLRSVGRNGNFCSVMCGRCQSQQPRGLRHRSAAARLLTSWVRIPPGPWMFVCCVCCVLSGRGLCNELITRPEESYRLWHVVVRDLETSRTRRP